MRPYRRDKDDTTTRRAQKKDCHHAWRPGHFCPGCTKPMTSS